MNHSNTTPTMPLDVAALQLIQIVVQQGSMAAAARHLNLVPSAITYRIRQLEDTLDVLLFDRSARRATLTPAGQELFEQGTRILTDIQALTERVKRVASGWEANLTIAVDSVISRDALFDLIAKFYELNAPTAVRVRSEVMLGAWEALSNGQADLSIGFSTPDSQSHTFVSQPIGTVKFVFAVAPNHPLAKAKEPLSDELISKYRAVAVADTARHQGMTVGLLDGQDTLTLPTINSKIEAQLRGLGCGFLPECQIHQYLASGQLITKTTERTHQSFTLYTSWRKPERGISGLSLKWWVEQLALPRVQQALLTQTGGGL